MTDVPPTGGTPDSSRVLEAAYAVAFGTAAIYVAGLSYYETFLRRIDVPFQVVGHFSTEAIVQAGGTLWILLVVLGGTGGCGAYFFFLTSNRSKNKRPTVRRVPATLFPVLVFTLLLGAVALAQFDGEANADRIRSQSGTFVGFDSRGERLNITGKVFLHDGGYLYIKDFATGAFYALPDSGLAYFEYDAPHAAVSIGNGTRTG